MRYSSLLRCKKMSFQRRSEATGTPSRVPERIWKRVPFHRTGDAESPTTQTCCDGVVEPSTGDGWPIRGVGGLRRRMYACSTTPSGTDEPCSADTGELRLRVYIGHRFRWRPVKTVKTRSEEGWDRGSADSPATKIWS